MIAFAFYLLKLIICSGILFLYYLIALRNKRFHHWNRYYLLSAVLLSIIIPIIEIPVSNLKTGIADTKLQLLKVVQSTNYTLNDLNGGAKQAFSIDQWIYFIYIFISIFAFFFFIRSLIKLKRIIRSHTIQYIGKIKFLNTRLPGTPFSFFNYIVWNEKIDLQSTTGRQIFNHELVHINEKHILDKFFIQLTLLIFWINPFFWLIRKELKLIHEFIADNRSIGEEGASALAAMIIQAAYPAKFNSLTNQFFQSSIKRRLFMINKAQNKNSNYLSRILILPFVLIIFMAFTLKPRPILSDLNKLEKNITVIIDAGHGTNNGIYSGARSGNLYEDDITLSLAKIIKELNSDKKLNIFLTRTSEENIDLKKRVNLAKEINADLFISIHVNADPSATSTSSNDYNSGIEVVVPTKNELYNDESLKLGSAIVSELKPVYKTSENLKTNAGVFVLNNSPCPAVLVECGYITNQNDREFIMKKKNQIQIAGKILTAIKLYESNKNSFNKENINFKTSQQAILLKDTVKPNPLLVIDGKVIGEFNKFKNEIDSNPENIGSINVLKDEIAIKKYGEKGKYGVIEIISKDIKKPILKNRTGSDPKSNNN